MKIKPIIIIPITLLVILIIVTILAMAGTNTQIHDVYLTETQVKGGLIDIYWSVGSQTANPDVSISVQRPDGVTRKYLMFDEREVVGDYSKNYEYHFGYTDTFQAGEYTFQINATGQDTDYHTGTFNVINFSLSSVNFVDLVETVQEVQDVFRVQKITNQTTIDVFGTEYQTGDNGRVFIQLVEGQSAVTDALCVLDAFYPDNSPLYSDAPMVHLNGTAGLYYYDIHIPDQLGVYMLDIFCQYEAVFQSVFPDDYAVGSATTLESGAVFMLEFLDTFEMEFDGNGEPINVSINFTEVYPPTNFTSIDIYTYGAYTDNGNDVYLHIYNYVNESWVELPNYIEGTGGGKDYSYINNQLSSNVTSYISDQTIQLQFISTGASSNRLYLDYLKIDFVGFGGIVQDIRGAGELHVSNYTHEIYNRFDITWDRIQQVNLTANNIWNYLTGFVTTTLTDINDTSNRIETNTIDINDTAYRIEEKLTAMNETLDNHTSFLENIWNYLTQDIWNKLIGIEELQNDTYNKLDNLSVGLNNQSLNEIQEIIENTNISVDVDINESAIAEELREPMLVLI